MKSSRKIDIIKLKFGSSQKHVFTAYFDARKKTFLCIGMIFFWERRTSGFATRHLATEVKHRRARIVPWWVTASENAQKRTSDNVTSDLRRWALSKPFIPSSAIGSHDWRSATERSGDWKHESPNLRPSRILTSTFELDSSWMFTVTTRGDDLYMCSDCKLIWRIKFESCA